MNEEYWCSDVRVRVADGIDAERVRAKFASNPLLAMHDVPELEKTEFELAAIAETVLALRKVASGLGVPGRTAAPERVHVLSRETFKGRIGNDIEGVATYGHAYVIRNEGRPRQFVHDLTHELSHVFSSFVIDVRVSVNGTETLNEIRPRRMGIALYVQSDRTARGFFGLNEALTETVAFRLRRVIARRGNLLDQKSGEWLMNAWAYYSHVMLCRRVLERFAEAKRVELGTALDALCFDYFSGSCHFMRALSRVQKGAVRALYRMGTSQQDALRAATDLGYDDVADKIARHIALNAPA